MFESEKEDREAIIWSYQVLDIIPEQQGDNISLEKELATYLNNLIIKDFNLLISILRRIDIEQQKVVIALADNKEKETAGETMARMIIARQKEKLFYRNLYKNKKLK